MKISVATLAACVLLGTAPVAAQDAAMSFFITSAGPGDGANLGGLEGADQHCQSLAAAVGSGELTWRAYLSTIDNVGGAAVNARDRIGSGPWYNYEGVMIARDVTDLHSDDANLTKETILTETGSMVNGRGDDPNMHDIITGSNLDGTAYWTGEMIEMRDGGDPVGYTACNNWTSNGRSSVRVGHHDRTGGGDNPTSWNSAHNSRGCSQENLQSTGGNGFFYCFATDAAVPQAPAFQHDDDE